MGARRDARDALADAGLRPHKRWGQHFLCDPGVVRRILDTAEVDAQTAVLEIGPGLGALTDALADRAGRLYAIEIDRGLAARLEERYAGRTNVAVIRGDVLELPLDRVVAEPRATVVANLPYQVTTPVLLRLLDLRARFARAVLMVQREVAVRLAARPGGREWGALAALVQTFGEVRIAFAVSRRAFLPVPRVDSTVIDVRWSPTARVPIGDVDTYRAVVRAAFGQRRKTLRNALSALAASRGLDAAALTAAFADAGVNASTRAERLAPADFARLARGFEV